MTSSLSLQQNKKELAHYMNNAHNNIKLTADMSKDSLPFLVTRFTVAHTTNRHRTQNTYPLTHAIQNPARLVDQMVSSSDIKGKIVIGLKIMTNTQSPESRTMKNNSIPKSFSWRLGRNMDSDRIPFNITYNPANPNMKQIIDKHWNPRGHCHMKRARMLGF